MLSLLSYTFIKNAKLKLAKNQANAKQHPEAELLKLKNYSHSSSTLSTKDNRTYSKKKQKKKWVCILEIIWLSIVKTGSHWHNINRPSSRHGHKYSKYEKCLSMMMLICIKPHISNIWS